MYERCNHLTVWLHLYIAKALYLHWETDERFRHRRLTHKANRASAKSSKYTGGSMTFMKTKVRLSKSLDRDVTMAVAFKSPTHRDWRSQPSNISILETTTTTLLPQKSILTRCWSSPKAFTKKVNSCSSLRKGIRRSSHACQPQILSSWSGGESWSGFSGWSNRWRYTKIRCAPVAGGSSTAGGAPASPP
ncbi:uncharacterized protein DS421_20g701660 [Arachis hypogaea]|nr:uncharacterized protein DS421_20g701660 [Arachis hypogaea]